jgi:hypothetical protein
MWEVGKEDTKMNGRFLGIYSKRKHKRKNKSCKELPLVATK